VQVGDVQARGRRKDGEKRSGWIEWGRVCRWRVMVMYPAPPVLRPRLCPHRHTVSRRLRQPGRKQRGQQQRQGGCALTRPNKRPFTVRPAHATTVASVMLSASASFSRASPRRPTSPYRCSPPRHRMQCWWCPARSECRSSVTAAVVRQRQMADLSAKGKGQVRRRPHAVEQPPTRSPVTRSASCGPTLG